MKSGGRIIIAIIIVIFTLISYFSSSEINELTGQKQYLAMSVDEEIALGLQAVPEVKQQYGGESADSEDTALVKSVGQKLLNVPTLKKTPYEFEFHVLADKQTVNAFALPGGQVFITTGLLNAISTEDQLAAVLAHEIVHVIGRHGAEQLAKQKLTSGLATATGVAAGDYSSAQMAAMVGQMVNMKYGRDDELESDVYGIKIIAEAGHKPIAMAELMKILQESSQGGKMPEFFSSHPNPENRIERIKEIIRNEYELNYNN